MDSAQVERVRRALRRRHQPPWRVLWRARPPARWADLRTLPQWRVRLLRLRAGWRLLWAERLRRDLDPIYRVVACRRGRHRDAHLLADDLIGSPLADDYPELAVCEVCGRAIDRVAKRQAQRRGKVGAAVMRGPRLEGAALAAVRHRGSHLQIIASAGSGKN